MQVGLLISRALLQRDHSAWDDEQLRKWDNLAFHLRVHPHKYDARAVLEFIEVKLVL